MGKKGGLVGLVSSVICFAIITPYTGWMFNHGGMFFFGIGSVLLVLAVTGVGVLGTLMAGWASANKYALVGGMRSAAQLLAYELPLVLSVASIAMAAGTLSLAGVVEAWSPWWLLWQLPGVRETRTYAVMEEVKSTTALPL